MDDDFGCTQALPGIEDDDSSFHLNKKQVACLEVDGVEHPIFSGSNTIGRDPDCSISIDSKAISLQHAVIEVDAEDSHLLADLGSKNKTRLGKLLLKPNVRYQLKEGNILQIADIICIYHVKQPECCSDEVYGAATEIFLPTENDPRNSDSIYNEPTQCPISSSVLSDSETDDEEVFTGAVNKLPAQREGRQYVSNAEGSTAISDCGTSSLNEKRDQVEERTHVHKLDTPSVPRTSNEKTFSTSKPQRKRVSFKVPGSETASPNHTDFDSPVEEVLPPTENNQDNSEDIYGEPTQCQTSDSKISVSGIDCKGACTGAAKKISAKDEGNVDAPTAESGTSSKNIKEDEESVIKQERPPTPDDVYGAETEVFPPTKDENCNSEDIYGEPTQCPILSSVLSDSETDDDREFSDAAKQPSAKVEGSQNFGNVESSTASALADSGTSSINDKRNGGDTAEKSILKQEFPPTSDKVYGTEAKVFPSTRGDRYNSEDIYSEPTQCAFSGSVMCDSETDDELFTDTVTKSSAQVGEMKPIPTDVYEAETEVIPLTKDVHRSSEDIYGEPTQCPMSSSILSDSETDDEGAFVDAAKKLPSKMEGRQNVGNVEGSTAATLADGGRNEKRNEGDIVEESITKQDSPPTPDEVYGAETELFPPTKDDNRNSEDIYGEPTQCLISSSVLSDSETDDEGVFVGAAQVEGSKTIVNVDRNTSSVTRTVSTLSRSDICDGGNTIDVPKQECPPTPDMILTSTEKVCSTSKPRGKRVSFNLQGKHMDVDSPDEELCGASTDMFPSLIDDTINSGDTYAEPIQCHPKKGEVEIHSDTDDEVSFEVGAQMKEIIPDTDDECSLVIGARKKDVDYKLIIPATDDECSFESTLQKKDVGIMSDTDEDSFGSGGKETNLSKDEHDTRTDKSESHMYTGDTVAEGNECTNKTEGNKIDSDTDDEGLFEGIKNRKECIGTIESIMSDADTKSTSTKEDANTSREVTKSISTDAEVSAIVRGSVVGRVPSTPDIFNVSDCKPTASKRHQGKTKFGHHSVCTSTPKQVPGKKDVLDSSAPNHLDCSASEEHAEKAFTAGTLSDSIFDADTQKVSGTTSQPGKDSSRNEEQAHDQVRQQPFTSEVGDDDIFNAATQKIPSACKPQGGKVSADTGNKSEGDVQIASTTLDESIFNATTQKRYETPTCLQREGSHASKESSAELCTEDKFDDDFFSAATQKLPSASKLPGRKTKGDTENKLEDVKKASTSATLGGSIFDAPTQKRYETPIRAPRDGCEASREFEDDIFSAATQKLPSALKPQHVKAENGNKSEEAQKVDTSATLTDPSSSEGFDDDFFDGATQKLPSASKPQRKKEKSDSDIKFKEDAENVGASPTLDGPSTHEEFNDDFCDAATQKLPGASKRKHRNETTSVEVKVDAVIEKSSPLRSDENVSDAVTGKVSGAITPLAKEGKAAIDNNMKVKEKCSIIYVNKKSAKKVEVNERVSNLKPDTHKVPDEMSIEDVSSDSSKFDGEMTIEESSPCSVDNVGDTDVAAGENSSKSLQTQGKTSLVVHRTVRRNLSLTKLSRLRGNKLDLPSVRSVASGVKKTDCEDSVVTRRKIETAIVNPELSNSSLTHKAFAISETGLLATKGNTSSSEGVSQPEELPNEGAARRPFQKSERKQMFVNSQRSHGTVPFKQESDNAGELTITEEVMKEDEPEGQNDIVSRRSNRRVQSKRGSANSSDLITEEVLKEDKSKGAETLSLKVLVEQGSTNSSKVKIIEEVLIEDESKVQKVSPAQRLNRKVLPKRGSANSSSHITTGEVIEKEKKDAEIKILGGPKEMLDIPLKEVKCTVSPESHHVTPPTRRHTRNKSEERKDLITEEEKEQQQTTRSTRRSASTTQPSVKETKTSETVKIEESVEMTFKLSTRSTRLQLRRKVLSQESTQEAEDSVKLENAPPLTRNPSNVTDPSVRAHETSSLLKVEPDNSSQIALTEASSSGEKERESKGSRNENMRKRNLSAVQEDNETVSNVKIDTTVKAEIVDESGGTDRLTVKLRKGRKKEEEQFNIVNYGCSRKTSARRKLTTSYVKIEDSEGKEKQCLDSEPEASPIAEPKSMKVEGSSSVRSGKRRLPEEDTVESSQGSSVSETEGRKSSRVRKQSWKVRESNNGLRSVFRRTYSPDSELADPPPEGKRLVTRSGRHSDKMVDSSSSSLTRSRGRKGQTTHTGNPEMSLLDVSTVSSTVSRASMSPKVVEDKSDAEPSSEAIAKRTTRASCISLPETGSELPSRRKAHITKVSSGENVGKAGMSHSSPSRPSVLKQDSTQVTSSQEGGGKSSRSKSKTSTNSVDSSERKDEIPVVEVSLTSGNDSNRTSLRKRQLSGRLDVCNETSPQPKKQPRRGKARGPHAETDTEEENPLDVSTSSTLSLKRTGSMVESFSSDGSGDGKRQNRGLGTVNSSNLRSSPRVTATAPKWTTYRVLFTGYNNKTQEELVKHLGGSLVEAVDKTDVLVTDKLRRTVKLLSVMGRGHPVVSPDWLTHSQKAGHFLDPWEFLLFDNEAEMKFEFTMKDSLQKARESPLLHGFSVFVTKSVKPPVDEMKMIITNCGGKFLARLPSSWPLNSVVISSGEDKGQWAKFRGCVTLVSSEWLLSGVLQQKLDMHAHCLK